MSGTMVDVWIIDQRRPYTEPKHALVELKRVADGWRAVHLESGRQFVVGVTAFFAREAAWCRWQGEMDRIRKSRYIKWRFPNQWERANDVCKVHVYR